MNKIERFKTFIRFIVSIFASREFAFVYCIVGTLAQTAHTYYLIESISSLDGYGKIFQAIGLSVFISSSLLFFTAVADNDESSKDYKRIHLAVNLFMWIEIIINFYYYAAHLIIKPNLEGSESNIFDFIFAVLVSCLIPITIKLYAGIIQAKEWFESFQTNKPETTDSSDFEDIYRKRSEAEQQWTVNYVSGELLKFKTTFIETFGEEISKKFDEKVNKDLKPEPVKTEPINVVEDSIPIISVSPAQEKEDMEFMANIHSLENELEQLIQEKTEEI